MFRGGGGRLAKNAMNSELKKKVQLWCWCAQGEVAAHRACQGVHLWMAHTTNYVERWREGNKKRERYQTHTACTYVRGHHNDNVHQPPLAR